MSGLWYSVNDTMLTECQGLADILIERCGYHKADIKKAIVGISKKNNLKIKGYYGNEIVIPCGSLPFDIKPFKEGKYSLFKIEGTPFPERPGVINITKKSLSVFIQENSQAIEHYASRHIAYKGSRPIAALTFENDFFIIKDSKGNFVQTVGVQAILNGMANRECCIEDVGQALSEITNWAIGEKNKLEQFIAFSGFVDKLRSQCMKKAAESPILGYEARIEKDKMIVKAYGLDFYYTGRYIPEIESELYDMLEQEGDTPEDSKKYSFQLKDDSFISKEAEKLRNIIEESALKLADTSGGTLRQQIDEKIDIYNTLANPLLNGLKPIKDKKTIITFIPKSGLKIECGTFDLNAVVKKDKIKLEFPEEIQDKLKDASSKRAQQCLEFIIELLKERGINMHVIEAQNQPGILYGSTEVRISGKGSWYRDITVNLGPYKNSITEWKKKLSSLIKDVLLDVQKKREAREQILIKKYERAYGNILSREILSLLHENDYITDAAITNALRGLKIQLSTTIRMTKGCGFFNPIKKEEIEKEIRRLSDESLLYHNKLKGTYGTFYITKLSKAGAELLDTPVTADIKTAKAKVKAGEKLNDYEAELLFLEVLKKNNLTTKDCIWALELLENNNAMACMHFTEYKEFFEKVPKEIKTLLSMKQKEAKGTATGAILSHIKKENKNKPNKSACNEEFNEESDIAVIDEEFSQRGD